MTQNLPKNIIGSVASIYQANLVIEIPNITENYVYSHLFTCRHWVAACLFKYTSRCWEVFLIGQIFFYSEGLGAKQNASGKLGMKLAIVLFGSSFHSSTKKPLSKLGPSAKTFWIRVCFDVCT